jgi:hypothetical protein
MRESAEKAIGAMRPEVKDFLAKVPFRRHAHVQVELTVRAREVAVLKRRNGIFQRPVWLIRNV